MMPQSRYDMYLRRMQHEWKMKQREHDKKTWTNKTKKLKGVRVPTRRLASKTGRR